MDMTIHRHVRRLLRERDPLNYWYVVKSGDTFSVSSAPRTESPPTGWVSRSVTKSTADLLCKKRNEVKTA